MFKSAIIKLSLWYMATIIGLCILFSFILYHFSSREISLGLQSQYRRIEITFTGGNPKRHLQFEPVNTDNEITLRSHHLLVDLVYFNIFAAVIAGFGSYALAKRTLQPLESAHEQQARFTSDVSHELRTPLSAIKTESEVALLDPTLSNEELKDKLRSNLEEVSRMEKLINNLLRISKLENQDLKKLFVDVDLKKAIKIAEKANRKQLDAKKINLNSSLSQLHVLGSEDNLTQAISIVLDNAVKYSDEGKSIDIIMKKRKSYAMIEVKDSGIGISNKDMPFIFDRFYRAEQSRFRTPGQQSGYGLGLPLAKFIVELHGGTINVSSHIGKGTIVSINLPLIKNS